MYSKTVWVNGSVPSINAINLNKIEQGIYDNNQLISGIVGTDTTVRAVNTIEEMLLLNNSIVLVCFVYDSVRGGTFIYDSNKANINDGGTILDGWVRQYKGDVFLDWFDMDKTGTLDETSKWDTAINLASNNTLYVSDGTYLKDRSIITSPIIIKLTENVVINGTNGGNNLFRVSGTNSVHFLGDNCTFNRDSTGTSHNLYFEGAEDCTVNNVNFNGAGGGIGKDCIYIGDGAGKLYSKNIQIFGGSCANALRNGISVSAGRDILIDGVEVYGTTGSPGSGIDIEANDYETVKNIEVRNCKIHDNQNAGILGLFGEGMDFHDNEIYGNGIYGIACESGGIQWNSSEFDGSPTTIARPQDLRPINDFSDDGWISVDDLTVTPIEVGTVVQINIRPSSGASKPSAYSTVRYLIYDIDTVLNRVKLSTEFEYNPIEDLGGDLGSGILSTDISITDFALACNEEGQCSNIKIYNNKVYNNGTIKAQINITKSVDANVFNNEVSDNSGLSHLITGSYSERVNIFNNSIVGNKDIDYSYLGINTGTASHIKIFDNYIKYCSWGGIQSTGGAVVERNTIVDCGRVKTWAMRILNSNGSRIHNNSFYRTPSYPLTFGIYTDGTVTNSIFNGNNLRGVGTTNANSIFSVSPNNIVKDNILQDGVLQ